jgi:Na+-driven multidrug efflux pump
MLLTVMMMGVRGSGDSMSPLFFGGLAAVLDAGLNPLFILGVGPIPPLGIAGSGLASLVGTTAATIGFAIYIYRADKPLRLRGPELRYLVPEGALARTIIVKGVPIAAQMLVIATSGLAVLGLVNREGVDTTAAYGVMQQLWAYVQMPAMAIGAAVSAMAAQNIGANRWDRVSAITRAGLIYNVLLTGGIVALLALFDRPLIALFLGHDSPAVPIAEHISGLATWNFILFGMTMVFFGTVRANGAVLGPLAILFVGMYPVRLGFAFALEPALGADAIWWSFPLGSFANVTMAALYYRSSYWRQGALVPPEGAQGCEQRSHADLEPGATMKPAG